MSETTNPHIDADGKCRFCGGHHGVQCPAVRAIEYHPDGSVKRVEYCTASDYRWPQMAVPPPEQLR